VTYLIATHSVIVVRDKQQKLIQPGQGEDFTDEEIATIRQANPAGLRAPVSESEAKVEAPKKGKAKAAKPAAAQADEDEDI